MTESNTFAGVYPAMVTPFTENGRIDYQQLRRDARRLERAGVDGLVPMGSTGESATVDHDEHIEAITAVVDAVDIPVVAGTGSNSTREAVSLSRRAAQAGADALLLIGPYYNRPEQRGLLDHYRTIADSVDRPQIVYNVPRRTGRQIAPETVIELARHENIQGYKAAGGDLGTVSRIVEQTREETFDVLSGNDGETLPILSVGGTGCISVAANLEPALVGELVGAALAGDYRRARALNHHLGPLFRALFRETNPVPVKAALAMRGHGGDRVRQPLTPLAPEYREDLATVLAAYDDPQSRQVQQ